MFSRLIAAEVEREDGEKERLDDVEIAGFATLWAEQARRPSPSWLVTRR